MKYFSVLKCSIPALLFLFFVSARAEALPMATQTFTLYPGWNAVFLEVQPDPFTPADVFSGMAVDVWTYVDRSSAIEFIQNPSEGLQDKPGWRGYFSDPTEGFLNNLFAIFAGRPYIIKVKGNDPLTWAVTGKPVLDQVRWRANSFNLVGFGLNPGSEPTFGAFFAPSAAHAGLAAYRLSAAGLWNIMSAADVMKSGESQWVYSEGPSAYCGPLTVEVTGNEIDFGKILMIKTIRIKNLSDAARAVSFTLIPPLPNVFVYKNINTTTQLIDWNSLETMPPLNVAAHGTAEVTLSVRRENMASSTAETVLFITDVNGTRIMLPVSAEK